MAPRPLCLALQRDTLRPRGGLRLALLRFVCRSVEVAEAEMSGTNFVFQSIVFLIKIFIQEGLRAEKDALECMQAEVSLFVRESVCDTWI